MPNEIEEFKSKIQQFMDLNFSDDLPCDFHGFMNECRQMIVENREQEELEID